MLRVYVCSPLRSTKPETTKKNSEFAEALMQAAMLVEGVAAYAPHAIYPRFLDDALPAERVLGMEAGNAFLEVCDEIWVYTRRGISGGMLAEVEKAARLGKRVVFNPKCWEGLGDA